MIPFQRMLQLLLVRLAVLSLVLAQKLDSNNYPIRVPRLERPPVIDGDLSEWKRNAFSDGLWDIARLAHSPWYDPKNNRRTDHGNEPTLEEDLAARYYIAWDNQYLYLGAEVKGNINDVADPAHEPQRWYYKDAICWFIEAPRTDQAKKVGVADNAFCFVIDVSRPTVVIGNWISDRLGDESEWTLSEAARVVNADRRTWREKRDRWHGFMGSS